MPLWRRLSSPSSRADRSQVQMPLLIPPPAVNSWTEFSPSPFLSREIRRGKSRLEKVGVCPARIMIQDPCSRKIFGESPVINKYSFMNRWDGEAPFSSLSLRGFRVFLRPHRVLQPLSSDLIAALVANSLPQPRRISQKKPSSTFRDFIFLAGGCWESVPSGRSSPCGQANSYMFSNSLILAEVAAGPSSEPCASDCIYSSRARNILNLFPIGRARMS